MDYNSHYTRLVERARNRTLSVYTETHHIVPRCMGGTNEATNLVALTPEEHYLAHQLLLRIYPNHPSLIHAAAMMGSTRPNNKIYGWLRRRLSYNMRTNNPNAGGKGRLGKTFVRKAVLTPDGRRRISDRMKSNNPNADGSCRLKRTVLRDESGTIVFSYDSVKDARDAHNANHGSILANMRRGTPYRGFYWTFEQL